MGAGMTLTKRRLMLNEPHLVSAQSDDILTLDTDMRAPLKALRVGFEPVQDLHGYDKPWPGGGGKNLWRPDNYISSGGTVNTVTLNGDEYTLTWNNGKLAFRVDQNRIYPAGTYTFSLIGSNTNNVYVYFYREDGSLITVITGSNTRTLADPFKIGVGGRHNAPGTAVFKVQMELGSTATDYEPYSNICPITGWDGVTVGVNGKNYAEIKPFSDWVKKYAYSTIDTKLPPNTRAYMTLTDKDASVDVSGVSLGFIDSSYTGATTLKNDQFRWVMQNGRVNSNRSNIPNNNDSSVYLNGLFIYPSTEAAYNKLVSRYNIMVELSPTATAYEPYQGSTVPISWADEAGTVYKGHAVINRDGSATVTATMASVDAGTLTWGAYNAPYGKCFYGTPPTPKQGWRGLSSDYVQHQIGFTQIENGEFTTGSGAGYAVFVRDDRYTSGTTQEFKAAMQGVQFVYELATPVTYTLTPQEVLRTLRGENNIWSDANGPISATYWTH